MLASSWQYKRFHISVLLTWLALGVLGGLFFGQYSTLPLPSVVVWLATLVIVSMLHSRRWFACIAVLIAGLTLGIIRGSHYLHETSQLDSFVGKTIILKGELSQDPVQQDESGLWQAQLNNISVDGKSFAGEIYATILSDETLQRNNLVTIQSKATAGFGSFRLTLYRAELKDLTTNEDVFLTTRNIFAEGVRHVVPEPEASLGLGFVVGQKSALPTDLEEQLKIVGLTHIVVASGYNLTILVRFARRLLARRSRYLALVGSAALVAGFVAISGLSPSMNRAAIVTSLSLLAWYYGRKFHPVQLILYVASVSALLYPVYIWSDLGWLLSFTAFAGVLVVAPIITRLTHKSRSTSPPSAIVQLVIETLSAQLMTLPIIMVYFGYIPLLAFLANLLVAPVIPFAMLTAFLAGLAGLVSSSLWVVAMPASIVIAYVVSVVEKLSSWSWAQVSTSIAPTFAWAWYGLLGGWLGLVWKRRQVDLRASSIVD